jgi:GcrA cell cycle regulator
MAPQFWIDERVEILKSRWAANCTAREIGKLLGCSRNAVIGKARRLGLPVSVHRNRAAEGRAKDVVRPRVPVRRENRAMRTPPTLRLVDLLPAKDEPPSRRIAFTDLKAGECRWISGDDGCCCGHATTFIAARGGRAASPYCSFHSARAYRAPRERSEPPALAPRVRSAARRP